MQHPDNKMLTTNEGHKDGDSPRLGVSGLVADGIQTSRSRHGVWTRARRLRDSIRRQPGGQSSMKRGPLHLRASAHQGPLWRGGGSEGFFGTRLRNARQAHLGTIGVPRTHCHKDCACIRVMDLHYTYFAKHQIIEPNRVARF